MTSLTFSQLQGLPKELPSACMYIGKDKGAAGE